MVVTQGRAVTLDASVWIAALRADEPSHVVSVRVMERLLEDRIPLIEPTLFPVEVAAAIRRRTGDMARAERAVRQVITLETLSLVDITDAVAADAARLAVHVGLRGADACYVAVARREQSILVTLDEELVRRVGTLADVVTPSAWLSRVQR
ncbi:MAG TPA: type II toxin-antitoxin system VapC family toxin [Gemmatimonas sp.]|nr:type II toxin-antitoxin system VapC family toxin [Gemmatimonas sp.]